MSYREETRTLEHVAIDPKKVSVAEPDEAKLEGRLTRRRRPTS